MSLQDLFTKQLWKSVGEDLRGDALDWWSQNEKALVGIAKDELAGVMEALRKGDTVQAKLEVAARMTPDEWRAYRDGTTKRLSAIATRRAALMSALMEIGTRAAKSVGRAALETLGL